MARQKLSHLTTYIPMSAKENCPKSAVEMPEGKTTSEYVDAKPFWLLRQISPRTPPPFVDVTNRSEEEIGTHGKRTKRLNSRPYSRQHVLQSLRKPAEVTSK